MGSQIKNEKQFPEATERTQQNQSIKKWIHQSIFISNADIVRAVSTTTTSKRQCADKAFVHFQLTLKRVFNISR